MARTFLEVFGDKPYIVAPSGSCVSMVKVFYHDLLRDDPELLTSAREVGSRVFELSEFVVDVLGVTSLSSRGNVEDMVSHDRVTYHDSCHLLRELGVTTQPRALIDTII